MKKILEYIKKLLCLNRKVNFVNKEKNLEINKEVIYINGNKYFLINNFFHLEKVPLLKNIKNNYYTINNEEINIDNINSNVNDKLNNININKDINILNINKNYIYLPLKNCNKPTLVLDLDHTLVYSSTKKLSIFDFNIEINYNKKKFLIYFIKRPFLTEFLTELDKYYELIIYTAGVMEYGLKIIKIIDEKFLIKYLLGRKYCSIISEDGKNKILYIKNLNLIGRDLKKTIIVDDREYSYILNKNNGQHIPPFYGDKDDKCLKELKDYLISISNIDDFTKIVKYKFTNYKN